MKILRHLGTGIVALCLFCTGSFLAGYKLYGGPGIFPDLQAVAEFRAVAPHLESLGTTVEGLLQTERRAPLSGGTVVSLPRAAEEAGHGVIALVARTDQPCPEGRLVARLDDQCREDGPSSSGGRCLGTR